MGYIFNFTIPNVKYLDDLSEYINNITANDGISYENDQLTIYLQTDPSEPIAGNSGGGSVSSQLTTFLTNYIPPQIFNPPIDFPETIRNLSVINSTISNLRSSSLIIFNTSNSLSLSTGSALTVLGESSFLGNVYFNNSIDLNNQVINNVTSPSTALQVANKYYVDNRFSQFTIGNVSGNFTQGQVIVATTGGNITGFSNFLFDGNLLSLNSTNNSLGLGSGGTLTVNGGSSFLGNVYFGSAIDLNSNVINNVTAPSLNLQAANKWYVDLSISAANTINGNFSAGQIIIGGSSQGTLVGYPNFIYNGNLLSLTSTNVSLGLGSGGTLNIVGGASILGNVYIGSGLDLNDNLITSVALPINPSDAVNKEYVDYYTGFNPGDIRERSFVLNNNVNTPTDVTGFVFLNTQISSFEAIVYLQIPEINIYDQWEIHGLLKGTSWIINTPFIGDHPSRVKFTITNSGQIQYTNTNNTGTATIRFRAYTTSQGLYTNTTIGNSVNLRSVPFGGTGTDFFTQGTLLIGDNTNSIKTSLNLMYLNNTLLLNNTSNSTNLSTATAVFSGGISIQKNLLVGTGIDINMQKITNLAIPTNPYDAANKFYVDSVFSSGGSLNLYGPVSFYNTIDATSVSNGGALTIYGGTSIAKGVFVGGVAHFVNTSNSTSVSTGSVIISGGLGVNGTINTNLIDASNISSNFITSTNVIFTNLTSTNAVFTNLTSTNGIFTNLTSTNGIFTNLTSSNISSTNISSTNFTSSNISSTNISSTNFTSSNILSTNITSSNISTSNMFINNVNMTPSLGDLFNEQSFNASDNVYTPDSITGFVFNNNVRYFTGWLSVFITASSNTVTAFTIEGIQINTGVWNINSRFVGTNIKMKISITNAGQIQYTCPISIPGFVSSLMKFRAITTTI
jgi:hypothetical protein